LEGFNIINSGLQPGERMAMKENPGGLHNSNPGLQPGVQGVKGICFVTIFALLKQKSRQNQGYRFSLPRVFTRGYNNITLSGLLFFCVTLSANVI